MQPFRSAKKYTFQQIQI